jgi:2-methylcitrate dehydratase
MDLADSLSEYAVSLRYSDLSEHAVHTAEQRLVDTLGCGLGAFDTVPGRQPAGVDLDLGWCSQNADGRR